MAEASDFKFGTQLGFVKAHHKITSRGKLDLALGYGSFQIFGVFLQYFCNGRAVLLALAELLVLVYSIVDYILCNSIIHTLSCVVNCTCRCEHSYRTSSRIWPLWRWSPSRLVWVVSTWLPISISIVLCIIWNSRQRAAAGKNTGIPCMFKSFFQSLLLCQYNRCHSLLIFCYVKIEIPLSFFKWIRDI